MFVCKMTIFRICYFCMTFNYIDVRWRGLWKGFFRQLPRNSKASPKLDCLVSYFGNTNKNGTTFINESKVKAMFWIDRTTKFSCGLWTVYVAIPSGIVQLYRCTVMQTTYQVERISTWRKKILQFVSASVRFTTKRRFPAWTCYCHRRKQKSSQQIPKINRLCPH